MKRFLFLFLGFLFVLQSCQSPTTDAQNKAQVEQLQNELSAVKFELQTLQSTKSAKTPLVHLVLLNIKDDLAADDLQKLKEAILNLAKIEVVHQLEIGNFEDLGDQRALSDFEIGFQMDFKSKADYLTYQQHPIHIRLKSIAKDYLAATPTTYDFLKLAFKE